MDKIIVDASALLCVLLGEPSAGKIKEYTDGMMLYAPKVIDSEIGNALSSLIKRNSISYSDSVFVFHEFCKIPLHSIKLNIPNALAICGEHKIYAYDAYYLDCAHYTGFPLLTLDKQLMSIAKEHRIRTISI